MGWGGEWSSDSRGGGGLMGEKGVVLLGGGEVAVVLGGKRGDGGRVWKWVVEI